jgi:hypothetical protein
VVTNINTDGIQRAVGLWKDAHNARVAAQQKIDAVKQEMRVLDTQLGAAQEELRKEEIKIAASGAKLPDQPFPIEAEIGRLGRHRRIVAARCEIFELQNLKPAEEQIRTAGVTVRNEWRLLAMRQTAEIRARYREAAAVLMASWAEYCLWTWQFPSEQDARDFPRAHACPALMALGPYEILTDPARLSTTESLEKAVPEAAAAIRELRSQIDGCK